ncbi:MAG TPA: glycosyltransferase family 39 protein [Candidatus Acidoferrales bacterium]|jgi:hypothetical protein|nr:glycosyltransferase family 39 protein [Candidatus Acidoferrales bacterium]
MEPGSTVSIKAAVATKAAGALLLTLFAVNVYRAAMQSITPPEAATYNRFVGPSLQEALALTTANNHVLNTFLARISTKIFHLTDLSLRLPSLMGGALYFWAVFRLARRAFGSGPLFLAAVALLSLNPLVLDYLSMARGYGLALAFWMWALDLMLEYLESDQPVVGTKLNLAGMCLGLSVAANLAFLVPTIALAVTFSLRPALCQSSIGKTKQMEDTGRRFQDLWLPAFITAFLILVIPANHTDFATFDHPTFNQGATSLRQTLNSLTALSLYHGNPAGLPPWLAGAVRFGVAGLVIGALILLMQSPKAIRSPQTVTEKTVEKTAENQMQAVRPVPRAGQAAPSPGLPYLLAGTILVSFAGLELGHRVLRIAFPLGRSGLYFIPVLTLAGLCLVHRLNRRAVEWAMLLVPAVYLLQFNVNRYGEWPEYANARSVIKAIRQDSKWRPVRAAASPGLDQVLNYYRARYALGLWPQVQAVPGSGSFDYYALNRADKSLVTARHLHVIWQDGNLTVAR